MGHYTTMGMHFERVQNHHPINRSFQTLPCSTGIGPPCYLCGFAFVGCLSSLSALRQYALLHLLHQPPQQQQQPDFLLISSFQRLWVASVVFSPTRHILQHFTHRPINQRTARLTNNRTIYNMINLCITRSGNGRNIFWFLQQFPGFLNYYCTSSSTFFYCNTNTPGIISQIDFY